MQPFVPFTLLAAGLLAACAAPVAQAPAPSAGPTTAPAPAVADEGDGSRAVHGSQIGISTTVITKGVDPNVAYVTVKSGAIYASPQPIAQATPFVIGKPLLVFDPDNLQDNRMGFWNSLAVDPNGGSNANYGTDLHLQLTLPSNMPAGVTITKVALQDTTTGGKWDSVGYPANQMVGVWSVDRGTQLLNGGAAAPVTHDYTLQLYMDTGNPDTSKNMARKGDSVDVQVDSSIGQWSWTGLQP